LQWIEICQAGVAAVSATAATSIGSQTAVLVLKMELKLLLVTSLLLLPIVGSSHCSTQLLMLLE
jgi:hypothetical protein